MQDRKTQTAGRGSPRGAVRNDFRGGSEIRFQVLYIEVFDELEQWPLGDISIAGSRDSSNQDRKRAEMRQLHVINFRAQPFEL